MRILMLGNSLTSANNLPRKLAELTGGEVVSHTRGGARLSEHRNPDTKLVSAPRQRLPMRNGTMWSFRR